MRRGKVSLGSCSGLDVEVVQFTHNVIFAFYVNGNFDASSKNISMTLMATKQRPLPNMRRKGRKRSTKLKGKVSVSCMWPVASFSLPLVVIS